MFTRFRFFAQHRQHPRVELMALSRPQCQPFQRLSRPEFGPLFITRKLLFHGGVHLRSGYWSPKFLLLVQFDEKLRFGWVYRAFVERDIQIRYYLLDASEAYVGSLLGLWRGGAELTSALETPLSTKCFFS
jgi:hypothetical protein